MLKTFTAKTLDELRDKAKEVPRLRTHLNVHETHEANVQRLFIATEPDTYMRPHRHPQPHKWEFFMVLMGEIDLLMFDESGNLKERVKMSETKTRAVEVPPGVWHCYVCQKSGTLAIEVKEGAYIPTPEEDFAPWAPAEGSEGAAEYLAWMRTAKPA